MTIFYISVTLIGLYYLLYYYFSRTFNYWKKRNVAGPEPTVFFGNLKEFTFRTKNIGVIIQEIYDMFPTEKVVGMYRMTTPCLLIRDLDIIKSIMIKDFDNFPDRGIEFTKRGLGSNLFFADGDTWRALRGRFSPIFTSGKLKNMFYLINERANIFMEYVSNEYLKNPELELHSLFQKFTISKISACAFGIDIDINDKMEKLKEIDKFVATPNYGNEINMMYPGLLKKLNLSILPTPVQTFFKNLVNSVITQRNGKPTGRHDFMDLILELRQMREISSTKYGDTIISPLEITDEVIAAQAFVFYMAGYRTSAITISYLLYHLALDQDIQTKVITEIDEVTKANDGNITYDSIHEMKYLHKVFDETLRMHSVVEPVQRMTKSNYKIPGTNFIIEKDTLVIISPRAIHYDEKYYPQPEVFKPERFDVQEVGSRHSCAYLPFGLGQRNCIGLRFAKLQSLLCVAKILSKFRVEPWKNTKRHLEITPDSFFIEPKDGIFVNFVLKKCSFKKK